MHLPSAFGIFTFITSLEAVPRELVGNTLPGLALYTVPDHALLLILLASLAVTK
jgi:hypothetical protein